MLALTERINLPVQQQAFQQRTCRENRLIDQGDFSFLSIKKYCDIRNNAIISSGSSICIQANNRYSASLETIYSSGCLPLMYRS